VIFYGLIILIGVTFAVCNRERIDLTLYPLPYIFSLPIYLFTIVIFMLGLLLGWMIARVATLKGSFRSKENSKRMHALENELTALRTEQMMKPVALTAR
jgi:uncharacterized integral membrane protein